jgi:two-component sensor histidine kinase
VLLSPKAAEVLTLGFHELATNSVKYGVLGSGSGQLAVNWTRHRHEGHDSIALRWTETGIRMPSPKTAPGFGTELVTRRLPYELGGEASMVFAKESLVVDIRFALADGTSVFQTDAGSFGAAA